MERVSKHISYNEAIRSHTAKRKSIKNIPNEEQLSNMKDVANYVFEPVRNHFSVPIYISSMFRSQNLNKALKGAKNSQHLAVNGAAIDIDADVYGMVTNEEIFTYIIENLEFDQCIAEGVEDGHIEWVHVSFNKGNNRKQSLIMYRNQFGTHYTPYTKENLDKFLNKKQ